MPSEGREFTGRLSRVATLSFFSAAFAAVAGAQAPCQGDPFDLVVCEVMVDPSAPTPDEGRWEWIELYNAGEDCIDFTGWVLDDGDNRAHSAPNLSGSIGVGEVRVLFNGDALTPTQFSEVWGVPTAQLIPVRGWSNMPLGNLGDVLGMWTNFASYNGDHRADDHFETVVDLEYDVVDDDWPPSNNRASMFLTDVDEFFEDPFFWDLSVAGSNGAVQAQAVHGNSGLDVGSPGTVPLAPGSDTAGTSTGTTSGTGTGTTTGTATTSGSTTSAETTGSPTAGTGTGTGTGTTTALSATGTDSGASTGTSASSGTGSGSGSTSGHASSGGSGLGASTSGSSAGATTAGSATGHGATGGGGGLGYLDWPIELKRPRSGRPVTFRSGRGVRSRLSGLIRPIDLRPGDSRILVQVAVVTEELAGLAPRSNQTIAWEPVGKVSKVNKKGLVRFAGRGFGAGLNLASEDLLEVWVRASRDFGEASSDTNRRPFIVR